MGISIKREATEKLAREVAKRTGESLTDAIHHALETKLAGLSQPRRSRKEIDAELAVIFAEIDARNRGHDNGRSLKEIEDEMYGEFGEPI